MPTALFTVKATITPDREKAFLASEHFAFLRQEYDRNFGGGVSDRQRASYGQVWP